MFGKAQAPRSVAAKDVHASQRWHLTFDMSGVPKARPLDGRVRLLAGGAHGICRPQRLRMTKHAVLRARPDASAARRAWALAPTRCRDLSERHRRCALAQGRGVPGSRHERGLLAFGPYNRSRGLRRPAATRYCLRMNGIRTRDFDSAPRLARVVRQGGEPLVRETTALAFHGDLLDRRHEQPKEGLQNPGRACLRGRDPAANI